MRNSVEITIDVTDVVPLPGPQHIAATVHLPQSHTLREPPIAIFASPGGGYNRRYFDLQVPPYSGYSEAEYHAHHGFVVVAYDHIGVGDSSIPDLGTITFEILAAANHAAVTRIAERLEQGSLTADLPPLRNLCKIGIGQSMGGCVTILMQGLHQTFDAIASLGFSAIHTFLPQPSAAAHAESELMSASVERSADRAKIAALDLGKSVPDFFYPFHWEDVPVDIRQADLGGGYPVRRNPPPWGSTTLPKCARMMVSKGAVSGEASAITVPVLVAAGERDTIPTPFNEPAAFRRSKDVSVLIIPRMAHMHNFASTRAVLWRRIEYWSEMIANR